MAVSENGEVMGVILNNIMCKDHQLDQYGDENFVSNSSFDDIEVLLYKIRQDVDLYGQYPNVDRIMELKLISVNEEYRGQGVCKALINKSKYTKYVIFIYLKNITIFRYS